LKTWTEISFYKITTTIPAIKMVMGALTAVGSRAMLSMIGTGNGEQEKIITPCVRPINPTTLSPIGSIWNEEKLR
jgi:hypothetical protein